MRAQAKTAREGASACVPTLLATKSGEGHPEGQRLVLNVADGKDLDLHGTTWPTDGHKIPDFALEQGFANG